MATTLIINPGSSSKKYALYRDEKVILSMRFEKVGDAYTLTTLGSGSKKSSDAITPKQFSSALPEVLAEAKQAMCITEPNDIAGVAIRIVAPGTYFQAHQIIDEQFIERLVRTQMLAPNHIPVALAEIASVKNLLPSVPLMAVSDSAFHATMPASARHYSLPPSIASQFDVYRFGYHGISVSSVVRQLASKAVLPARLIVCHIGSGVSVTAVKDGKSVDTTMGFAPGSGLPMGTRSGDVDAGALLALITSGAIPLAEARHQLERVGGLQALGGQADFRLILEKSANGDVTAQATLDFFLYHMQKTIGAYTAALGGLDMLVLTATAAERSSVLRTHLGQRLGFLNISIDETANESLRGSGVISDTASQLPVVVQATDEMGEMQQVLLQRI